MAFDRSYETQLLYEELKKGIEAGQKEWTYKELSSVAGVDVQAKGRSYLASARRSVESDTQVLLGTVPTVGIKVMTASEHAAIGTSTVRSVRRKSDRTLKRMVHADFDGMTEKEKRQHNAAASSLGVVRMFSAPASVKKIADKQPDAGKLPIGETLRLFQE